MQPSLESPINSIQLINFLNALFPAIQLSISAETQLEISPCDYAQLRRSPNVHITLSNLNHSLKPLCQTGLNKKQAENIQFTIDFVLN